MSSEHGAVAPIEEMVPSRTRCRIRAAKRAIKRFSRRVLGWLLIALGLSLIAAGFVLIIIPGHYFLIVFGLVLVLGNSFWARRQFVHLKRRHPNWVMPIRKLLRRNPPVVSVFWQQVLKAERFILRGRGMLVGMRRRFLRRARPV
ncbi:hypothetical protein [Asticcacaulis sp. EMRT-3]|uniref:hypothetical protein n=1 Tax=Asticcacaulis sp. EMRT-3 TaxID=3040349 RepID=UPI0024AFEF81|nr:hypothetical protein [Asticcacaulis sp. EMRT-3]MDI7774206.1 hypothetical protein [Asticcacaulis sp. EMRT-3]